MELDMEMVVGSNHLELGDLADLGVHSGCKGDKKRDACGKNCSACSGGGFTQGAGTDKGRRNFNSKEKQG